MSAVWHAGFYIIVGMSTAGLVECRCLVSLYALEFSLFCLSPATLTE